MQISPKNIHFKIFENENFDARASDFADFLELIP